MQQGRWVSYIFVYRNGIRCENAGFIKVQRLSCKAGDEARIQIGLKLMKDKACKCQVYMLYNDNKVKYLTDIDFQAGERDTIMKRVEIPWDRPFDDVIPFDAYDGLFFVCDDGELLAGLWQEHKLDVGSIAVAEEKAYTSPLPDEESVSSEENYAEEEAVVQDERENVDTDEGEAESRQPEDILSEAAGREEIRYDGMSVCKQMIATYPRIPLLSDSQFLECVKIVPQDIGKLSMGNWKLGVNSFLSHGYYHYRYIMLGKVKFDKNEIYVIGVPGVFTNKEKYLANMFGFNVFVPVKKTKLLTGNFGYWISEISSE